MFTILVSCNHSETKQSLKTFSDTKKEKVKCVISNPIRQVVIMQVMNGQEKMMYRAVKISHGSLSIGSRNI